MRSLIIVAVIAMLAGCAVNGDLKARAIGGQFADVASTAVALSQPNTFEANPLGVMLIPLKVGAFIWADKQPASDRIYAHRILSAYGWGAAASNICTAAVVSSGDTMAVPCLFLGIAIGRWGWVRTQGTEREQFDRLCEYGSRKNPDLECIWNLQ